MRNKRFIKNIENFSCERCGAKIKGNGYTNHCPACLWSKHVDVNPGDRAAECGGLMEPVKIEKSRGKYVIAHKCVKCGRIKKNKISKEDNFDKIIGLSLAGQNNVR